MILLKTTDILRFHLGGAIATTELDFVTSYVDITGFSPGNDSGTSNGGTDVTIIGSPTTGIRQVKFISIVNTDSAAADVTVELYNGANARVLLTWTLNVLDSLTYIDSEGWKVLDSSGKLKVTTGGGGGGSVTSADYTSLKNRVSANSAQMTSANNAISNAVSVVSAAAASVESHVNTVSNAVSVVSAATASVEAHVNTVSNAVSVVSVAVGLKNDKVTIQNQGSNTVSNPTTINFYGNAVSTFLSTGVTKVQISTAAGTASVTSAELIALSATLQSAINTVSAQVVTNSAQMTSANNAISNAVSVISVAQANTSAAVTSVNNAISVISQQVSVLSARVASNSAQMVSADNAISNAVSVVSVVAANATSIANAASAAAAAVSADLTSVKNLVSVISQQVSVLSARVATNSAQMVSADNAISNAVSIVSVAAANALSVANAASNAISVEIANRISAVNVVSNAVSIVSVAVTLKNDKITIQEEGSNIASNPATINFRGDGVSAKLSGGVVIVSIATGAGGGSVTSTELSAAVAALSNSISVVSAAAAIKNPAITIQGEGVTIVSAPQTINFRGSGVSSKLSAGVVVVSIATGGGGGSVTSANFASLQSVVAANSAQMTSADNAINQAVSVVSVAQAATSAAVTSVNQIISVISQQVSVLSVRVAANSAQMTSANNVISNAVSIVSVAQAATSAAVTSVNNRISGVSADLTSFKASLNNFGDVSISSPTSGQVLTYVSVTGQWINTTPSGGPGGGSVTSVEYASLVDRVSQLSAVFSNQLSVISANIVVLSNNVSTLSAAVVVLSNNVSAADAAVSVLQSAITTISNQVSALGGFQRTVVQGIQSIAVSTYTRLSGLTASLAANAVYQIEGQIVFNVSAISATGYNIQLVGSALTQRYAVGAWQYTSAMAASTGGANVALLNHNFHGLSGARLSVTSAGTAQTNIVVLNGMVATSTTGGQLNIEGRVLVTTSPMHIFYGSYLIARRLQ